MLDLCSVCHLCLFLHSITSRQVYEAAAGWTLTNAGLMVTQKHTNIEVMYCTIIVV